MGNTHVSTKWKSIPDYPPEGLWKVKKVPSNLDIVTGIMSQATSFGTYNPECSQCNGSGCYAGECSAFTNYDHCWDGAAAQMKDANGTVYNPEGKDYTAYFENCFCSTKPICSRPNVKSCFLGKSSNGEEPTYRADWSSKEDPSSHEKDQKHLLKCTYDITKIDTADQVFKYRQLFGNYKDNDPEYDRIMRKFCTSQSDNCPLDPTTGLESKKCSLVTSSSNDPGSQLCKVWYDKLNSGNKDSFIDLICNGKDTADNVECKCVNRANYESYKELLQVTDSVKDTDISGSGAIIPDSCWYLPCKSNHPAFLRKSGDDNPKCPSNFCQAIYNVQGTGGNVTIANNQSYMSCPIKDSDDNTEHVPDPEPLPDIKPPEPVPPTPAKTVHTRKYLGMVIIVLLLLVSIILFFRK